MTTLATANAPLAEPSSAGRPIPETPEGVALALLYLILDRDRCRAGRQAIQPVAAELLDLYAECLRATGGERTPNRESLQ